MDRKGCISRTNVREYLCHNQRLSHKKKNDAPVHLAPERSAELLFAQQFLLVCNVRTPALPEN